MMSSSKVMSALCLIGEWMSKFEDSLVAEMLNVCVGDHVVACPRCGQDVGDCRPRCGFDFDAVRPEEFAEDARHAWLENQNDTGWDESLEGVLLDVLDQADNPELASRVERLKRLVHHQRKVWCQQLLKMVTDKEVFLSGFTLGDDVEIESLCDDLSVLEPFAVCGQTLSGGE